MSEQQEPTKEVPPAAERSPERPALEGKTLPAAARANPRALLVLGALVVVVFWVVIMALGSRNARRVAAASAQPSSTAESQSFIERALREAGKARVADDRAALPPILGGPQESPLGAGDRSPGVEEFPTWDSSRPLGPGPHDPMLAELAAREAELREFQEQHERALARPREPDFSESPFTGRRRGDEAAPDRVGFSGAAVAERWPQPVDAPVVAGGPAAARGLLAGVPAAPMAARPDEGDPLYQAHQDRFVERAAERRIATLRPKRGKPETRYELKAGSIIPAVLQTAVNSDLAGQVTGLVRRDVFDSVSGDHVLIPQGTRLIGHYDNRVAYGQKRVLIAWDRLQFPDGTTVALFGMPGTDHLGRAGLRDRVNNHYASLYGQALLMTIISAGAQLSQPQEAADGGAPSSSQIAAAAAGQELSRVSGQLVQRNLMRQPTLELDPGLAFSVDVTADIVFDRPWAAFPSLVRAPIDDPESEAP